MFLLHILFAFFKIWQNSFRKSYERIKIIKSYCYIWVLMVMATIQWRFLAVANPVTMVNDRWLAADISDIYIHTHIYIYKQVSFKEKNLINLVEISNRFFHGLKLDGHISEREKWSILCTNMKKLPIRESYISYLRFTRDMMYQ